MLYLETFKSVGSSRRNRKLWGIPEWKICSTWQWSVSPHICITAAFPGETPAELRFLSVMTPQQIEEEQYTLTYVFNCCCHGPTSLTFCKSGSPINVESKYKLTQISSSLQNLSKGPLQLALPQQFTKVTLRHKSMDPE